MKFKKMLCTLAAITLSSMAFAGNSSPLQVAVNDFSSTHTTQQDEEMDAKTAYQTIMDIFFDAIHQALPEKTQQDKDTDKAIKMGFFKLLCDDNASTLDENEQAIMAILFQDVPSIMEDMNALADDKDKTIREVEEEQNKLIAKMNTLFASAAEKVIKNQTEVPASKVNAERAKQVTSLFYTQLISTAAFLEMGDGAQE